jgi:ribonuclease VapC
VKVAAIDDGRARRAVEAFARYGKGRGSKAQLNFGDCLSYAVARQAGVPILFVGDDFTQTDLAAA